MAITSFRGRHRFLSNFYPSPLTWEGIEWPTSEHAYQAAKAAAVLGMPLDITDLAIFSMTPGEVKSWARQNVPNAHTWDRVPKIIAMAGIVWQKFKSPDMRALLDATAPEQLVEGNAWNDRFWGVCRDRGENQLGKILMLIRDKPSFRMRHVTFGPGGTYQ
jgi:ribA/ribD-fused uncharacterized protein